MKRKLITVLMFLVVSFLLAGCDLFGGGTTTTAETSTTTTTTQQTTTEPATVTTTQSSTTTTTQSSSTTTTTTTQITTQTFFTVTFLNGDGSTLSTQSVVSGGAATAPTTTPTKAATAQYTYTFSHWDVAFSNVTQNMVINPVFTESVNSYTVSFYHEDGTLLDTQTVAYGSAAVAPTEPTKAGTAVYTYTFDHWDVAFSFITGNLDVHAVFVQAIHTYTVTFYDYDGALLATETVAYGSDATPPVNPFRASDATNAYTFNGWDAAYINVMADVDIHATYLAVPLGQTYTVNFYDGDGNILTTQVVNHGDAATAPVAIPTKAADAQFTFTFSGWDQAYATVDSDLNIYPLFSKTVNEYTVTFYDYDGTTVLSTQTVAYGSAAVPPVSPQKPGDSTYTYTFIGWDANYSFVMGNLDVYPQYFQSPIGAFNRQNLVDLVDNMFSPDDTEAQITELMTFTGSVSEEALYHTLLAASQLLTDLKSIDSAGDVQQWFAATQALGFDKTTLIDILYSAMVAGFSNDVTYINNRVTELNGFIAQEQANISSYQGELVNFENEVSAYCAVQTEASLCQQYFNMQVDYLKKQADYYDTFDNEIPEEFDWDFYYQVEYYLDTYLWYTYADSDPTTAQDALNNYNNALTGLSATELAMYQYHLDAFNAWRTAQYTFYGTDFSVINDIDAAGTDNIMGHIDNIIWGYYDTENHEGYNDYLNQIEFSEWLIIEYTWEIEDAQNELIQMTALVTYLTSVDGQAEAKALMGTVYDGIEAVVGSLDEEMYNFVMEIVTTLTDDGYGLRAPAEDYYKNPFDILATTENIDLFTDKVTIILSAFLDSLDATDYQNIKNVVLGYFEEMLRQEGRSELEITAFLTIFDPVVDRYIGYFQEVSSEVVGFLDSIDEVKSAAIVPIFSLDIYDEPADIDLMIFIAQSMDILIGDGSLDVSMIMQDLAGIYFDVTNQFVPDTTQVATIQSEIDTFMVDFLGLIHEVAGYDPNYISPTEVERVLKLFGSFLAIGQWFDSGFEAVEDPIVVYQEYYLSYFLNYYLDMEYNDTVVDLLMDVLGTTDRDTTYYYLRSLFQYAIAVMKFDSFEDIQYWVANLESFDFTQAQIVGYFVDMLTIGSEDMITGDYYFQEQLNYLNDQVTYYNGMVSTYQDTITTYDGTINAAILLLPLANQATATSYWAASIQHRLLEQAQYDAYNWMLSYLGSTDAADAAIIIYTLAASTYPTIGSNYATDLAAYDALLALYEYDSYTQQTIIDFHDAYFTYYEQQVNEYDPLYTTVHGDSLYTTFSNLVDANLSDYVLYLNYLESAQAEVQYYLDAIDELYNELWMEFIIYDMMHDSGYQAETEDALNVLLDDIQNMITSMPSNSFSMIEEFIAYVQSTNSYGLYMEDSTVLEFPDFTASEIYQLTQEISMFLKLRGDTFSTADLELLEQVLNDAIHVYVVRLDLDPTAADAMETQISTLILKYIDFADLTLTELTDFLDGLTVADVQAVMDFAQSVANNEDNIYSLIIQAAQLFTNMVDPATVDIYLLANMINEVYYDSVYGVYDPNDLANFQAAWETYFSDLYLMMQTAAALDPDNLDPTTFGMLYELMDRIKFAAMIFADPEAIFYPPTFGYEYSDFQDLVYSLFNDVDMYTVDDRINELCAVFGVDPINASEVFYALIGIGSSLRNLDNVQSITDILGIYEVIRELGYDNTEIAVILVNALETFLIPNLPSMYDTTNLESELLDYQNIVSDYGTNISAIEAEVMAELDAIVDVNARQDAYVLWEAYKAYYDAEIEYYYYYYMYNGQDNFDWGLWWTLVDLQNNGYWSDIDLLLNEYDSEESNMYYQLLNVYSNYNYRQAEMYALMNNFNNNYPMLITTIDYGYPITSYLSYRGEDYSYQAEGLFSTENYIAYLNDEIQRVQDSADFWMMLEDFFNDPTNLTLTENTLVVLLDQVEAYTTDPNIAVFDFIFSMMGKNPFEMPLSDLAAEANNLGAFMTTMFSTIDSADEATLNAFIDAMITSYFTANESDPVLAATRIADVTTVVDTYFSDLMDIPALLGSFFSSITEAKLQVVYDQLMITGSLTGDGSDLEQLIEVVAVANILDALIGDGSLDYVNIYTPVYGFLYDMNVALGDTPDIDKTTMLASSLSQMAAILTQIDVVVLIDTSAPTTQNYTDMQSLMDFVNSLGEYLAPLIQDNTTA